MKRLAFGKITRNHAAENVEEVLGYMGKGI
jgi:hypothetical protein